MKTTQVFLSAVIAFIGLQAAPAFAGKPVPPLTVSKLTPYAQVMPLRKDKTLKADYVLVLKGDRKLILYKQGKAISWYNISLGGEWYNMLFGGVPGAKQVEGDYKTPEGRYVINVKNPESAFHLSLQISYPDSVDEAVAKKLGQDPGGEIMIHGMPNRLEWLGASVQELQTLVDWTAGCMAVTNLEIEEIYRAVPMGTTIDILP